MRAVLVGPWTRRQRLRRLLPDSVEVIGETSTLGEARAFEAQVDAYVLAAIGRPELEAPAEPLTTRERQVLELLADGLSNRTIAERLGVSHETVKFHLSAIFGKLGVGNRTEAVRQALRWGLVTV